MEPSEFGFGSERKPVRRKGQKPCGMLKASSKRKVFNSMRGGQNVKWHFIENSKISSLMQNYSEITYG
jgi:hypothetical protein